MSVIREGYAGKTKGRKQVLWERGWFLQGMSTTATVAPEMNIDTVLDNLPDFKNERPALHHLVESAHPAALAKIPLAAGRGGDRVLLGDVQAEISAGDQRRSPEAPSPKHGRIDVHGHNPDGARETTAGRTLRLKNAVTSSPRT